MKCGKERVAAAFERPGFVGYTVAGDPNPVDSVEVAKSLIEGGCDVLELGVPFSDPVADGSVIQGADKRAIDAGIAAEGFAEGDELAGQLIRVDEKALERLGGQVAFVGSEEEL